MVGGDARLGCERIAGAVTVGDPLQSGQQKESEMRIEPGGGITRREFLKETAASAAAVALAGGTTGAGAPGAPIPVGFRAFARGPAPRGAPPPSGAFSNPPPGVAGDSPVRDPNQILERTSFQTGRPYSPRIDIKADGAMGYGLNR